MLITFVCILWLGVLLFAPEDPADGYESSFIFNTIELVKNPSSWVMLNKTRWVAKLVIIILTLISLFVYLNPNI